MKVTANNPQLGQRFGTVAPGADDRPERVASYDLVVVGGGSAGFSAALRARELGKSVAIINRGLIGGTCVNVGCVPSKTMIRAAQVAHAAESRGFAGVRTTGGITDYAALVAQKDALVDTLRGAKYADLVAADPGIVRIDGHARFVSPHELEVDGERLCAHRVLIATGTRPAIPELRGLEDVGSLTSTTALALKRLPSSLLVLGGGYIGLELAQMFARFGVKVTILHRGEQVLSDEDTDVCEEIQRWLIDEGVTIQTSVQPVLARLSDGATEVTATVNGETKRWRAEALLVATGRVPNTSDLGLAAAGVEVDARGFVVVDETLSAAAGVYAAGDVIGDPSFVYTAAYEGQLAVDNAFSRTAAHRDYTAVPWVVFTDPHVAGVGLGERQAARAAIAVDVARLELIHVPMALAARDTRGFIKLLRRSGTDELVGARIVAPEGGEQIATAALAIRHGIGVSALASGFVAYLTQAEGLKLAAQTFDKDVSKLSCCAA